MPPHVHRCQVFRMGRLKLKRKVGLLNIILRMFGIACVHVHLVRDWNLKSRHAEGTKAYCATPPFLVSTVESNCFEKKTKKKNKVLPCSLSFLNHSSHFQVAVSSRDIGPVKSALLSPAYTCHCSHCAAGGTVNVSSLIHPVREGRDAKLKAIEGMPKASSISDSV